MRREFSAKVKAQAALRANGHCENCTRKLLTGDHNYDHDLPDAMGGEPTLENCKLLCRACHQEKTSVRDVPTIAKSNRVRRKHLGIKKRKRTIPGKRFNGDPIPSRWV